jgi:hypothetical protein
MSSKLLAILFSISFLFCSFSSAAGKKSAIQIKLKILQSAFTIYDVSWNDTWNNGAKVAGPGLRVIIKDSSVSTESKEIRWSNLAVKIFASSEAYTNSYDITFEVKKNDDYSPIIEPLQTTQGKIFQLNSKNEKKEIGSFELEIIK